MLLLLVFIGLGSVSWPFFFSGGGVFFGMFFFFGECSWMVFGCLVFLVLFFLGKVIVVFSCVGLLVDWGFLEKKRRENTYYIYLCFTE